MYRFLIHFGLSFLILSLLSAAATALTAEIPMPGLTGDYVIGMVSATHADTLRMAYAPNSIESISLRLSGVVTRTEYQCDMVTYVPAVPCFIGGLWDIDIGMVEYLSQENLTQSGEFLVFSTTGQLGEDSQYLIDFLLSETPTIKCAMMDSIVPGCWALPPYSRATVTEAVLIIDGELVAAANVSSWDSVKSLYR